MKIEAIFIYPIKSVGGVSVKSAQITSTGSLLGDREWLVVDSTGEMRWQGDLPNLTLLSADIEGTTLGLSNQAGERVAVDVQHGGARRTVRQYGFSFSSIDAGDEMAQALSDWTGQSMRLVRVGEEAHRWPKFNPVHCVSDLSHIALNARLAEKNVPTVEIERFRPNVILSADWPWQEEVLDRIDFGAAALIKTAATIRCMLPNINRETALISREPLYTIAQMSRERSTGRRTSFGVYTYVEGQSLEIGMSSSL